MHRGIDDVRSSTNVSCIAQCVLSNLGPNQREIQLASVSSVIEYGLQGEHCNAFSLTD